MCLASSSHTEVSSVISRQKAFPHCSVHLDPGHRALSIGSGAAMLHFTLEWEGSRSPEGTPEWEASKGLCSIASSAQLPGTGNQEQGAVPPPFCFSSHSGIQPWLHCSSTPRNGRLEQSMLFPNQDHCSLKKLQETGERGQLFPNLESQKFLSLEMTVFKQSVFQHSYLFRTFTTYLRTSMSCSTVSGKTARLYLASSLVME